MKLPRDISGEELCNKLALFGYLPTRQTGSHIRLTTIKNGEHHLTVPKHEHLRIGTLSGILYDVATHFGLSKEEIINNLF
jgi:predicted RNA binding protein YcfA (HicA-like mRNA interferase family)